MVVYHLLDPFLPFPMPDGSIVYTTEAYVMEGEEYKKTIIQVREEKVATQMEKHFRTSIDPLTMDDLYSMMDTEPEATIEYN